MVTTGAPKLAASIELDLNCASLIQDTETDHEESIYTATVNGCTHTSCAML